MQRLCNAYVPPLCRLCNGSLKRRYIDVTYLEERSCMHKRWIEENETGKVLQSAYPMSIQPEALTGSFGCID
jgi:hypothetical protein